MTENLTKRATCSHCHYPLGQCVCHLISAIDGDITVWVIQDKLEAKHAKNTARLFALCYPNTRVVRFSCAEEMSLFLQQVSVSNSLLLYPGNHSSNMESLTNSEKQAVEHLILLDGTWPKAKKMLWVEPELAKFHQVQFSSPPTSQYDIRKSPHGAALSTFEAAVYGLECLGMLQISKLRNFFSAAIALQWSKQPQEHKHRS